MNIKKTRTPGQCQAMRCTAPASDLLCEKHEAAWRADGSPPLTVATPAPAGSSTMVPAALEPELTGMRHQLQAALAEVPEIPVESDQDREFAGRMITAAAAEIKELEERRTSVVKPLNDAVKTINSWFKPNVEFLEQFKRRLGDKLSLKLRALAAERQEALAQIEAGRGTAPAEAFEAAHKDISGPSTVQVRKVTKWRITDRGQIPGNYFTLVLNEDKVTAAVKAGEKVTGIEVYEEDQIVAGRTT